MYVGLESGESENERASFCLFGCGYHLFYRSTTDSIQKEIEVTVTVMTQLKLKQDVVKFYINFIALFYW